jgi:hypothetical protein
VGLGEGVVDLEGFDGGGLGLGPGLAGQLDLVAVVDGVAVGQAGIGQSVTGVLVDRLLEVLDGALERLLGPAVPVVAALYVRLIGVGVFRGALRQPLLALRGRLQLQLLGNRPGNLLLEGEDLGESPAVLPAPELRDLCIPVPPERSGHRRRTAPARGPARTLRSRPTVEGLRRGLVAEGKTPRHNPSRAVGRSY